MQNERNEMVVLSFEGAAETQFTPPSVAYSSAENVLAGNFPIRFMKARSRIFLNHVLCIITCTLFIYKNI